MIFKGNIDFMYKMASISISVSILLPTENDICQSFFSSAIHGIIQQDKQIDLYHSQSPSNSFFSVSLARAPKLSLASLSGFFSASVPPIRC